MGHRCTISGHIQEAYYVLGSDREINRLWRSNRRVLATLPDHERWPFLPRRMFAASPLFSGRNGIVSATYRGPVIYFGGSFSSLFDDWSEWLEKFETLLRRLYWEHAAVILVTEWMGEHVYRWDSDLRNFTAERPTPIQNWTFTGGPRDFGEVCD